MKDSDILHLIFENLSSDIRDLLRVKLVCKKWYFVVNRFQKLINDVKNEYISILKDKNPDPESLNQPILKIAYIKAFEDGIAFVPQSDEFCEIAIQNHLFALKYIRIQKNKFCESAIRKNFRSLYFIRKQTWKLCFLALKQNLKAYKYIRYF